MMMKSCHHDFSSTIFPCSKQIGGNKKKQIESHNLTLKCLITGNYSAHWAKKSVTKIALVRQHELKKTSEVFDYLREHNIAM